MEKLEKKQGSIIAILAMVFLFAMIAFVTNLCSPMAVILKNNFSVSESLAQVGNYGNFGAYLLMGIPAGLLIQKFGYKTTALAALVVGIVGLLVQWLSGSVGFVVYLIGAFVSGLCMCMLNAVVNPMLNLLGGGGNRGNQLVQIGGVFNSAAAVCVYILMGSLIGDAATAKVSDAQPALFIALAIFSGSSSIRTISAASMAASEPKAPMAMPRSERDSTGASLTPSPTKAIFPFRRGSERSCSILVTLSAGRS